MSNSKSFGYRILKGILNGILTPIVLFIYCLYIGWMYLIMRDGVIQTEFQSLCRRMVDHALRTGVRPTVVECREYHRLSKEAGKEYLRLKEHVETVGAQWRKTMAKDHGERLDSR